MILASLRGLVVPGVLSAAARLARTASLHPEAVF